MILLRFAIAEVECSTVDEAVELLTRYQEKPRPVHVLRARAVTSAPAVTTSVRAVLTQETAAPTQEEPESVVTSARGGSADTATSSPGTDLDFDARAEAWDADQGGGHATFAVVGGKFAEGVRAITTREEAAAAGMPWPEVTPVTMIRVSPAIEDDPAAAREDEAREIMPDAATPDEEPEQPPKRTRSEIMRENWAKRRANGTASAAPKRPRRELPAVDGLPPVERTVYGQPRGCGAAVLTAFSRDPHFPLSTLAEHVYGAGTVGNVAKLRALIGTQFIGKLEPITPDGYRVTRRGEEALRAVRESAERVAKMQEGSAEE